MSGKSDGMNYAPKGKPKPVVGPGEFKIAAMHLDHGHIYGMCNGLTFIIGTDGYIELRKYVNVATQKTGNHVFLVNKDGEQHFEVDGKVAIRTSDSLSWTASTAPKRQ